MSLFARIMVVVNFILAVAFLAAAGTLLGAAEDYKAKYETSKTALEKEVDLQKQLVNDRDAKLVAASGRQTAAESSAASANASLKTLQSTNDQLFVSFQSLKADYDKLAASQTDLQARIAEKDNANTRLTSDLATSEAARKDAEGKGKAKDDEIARLSQEKDVAEKNLDTATVRNNELQKASEDDKITLERYRKEKGALTGAVAMKSVHGVVMAGRNDVDIYVISVGSKDNVEAGYEFTVYRGSEYVSTIVIDHVFPNYASGTTKPGTKKREIQAGDEVATQL